MSLLHRRLMSSSVAASLPCGDRRLHAWHQGHAMSCRLHLAQRHAMPAARMESNAHATMHCHAIAPCPCHAMPCHAMPCHAMPCRSLPMPCHAMPCRSLPMPCHAAPPMPQAWAWWRRTAPAPPSLRWGSVWWAPPLTPSMVSELPGAQCSRHCAWHACRTTMGMLAIVHLMLGRLQTACSFAYTRIALHPCMHACIALHPCIHAPMLQAAPARGSSTCWWAKAAWLLCRTPSAMMPRHRSVCGSGGRKLSVPCHAPGR